jgi:hypothetical protein
MPLVFLEVSMMQQHFSILRLHALQSNSLVPMSGFGLIVHMGVIHGVLSHSRGQLREI